MSMIVVARWLKRREAEDIHWVELPGIPGVLALAARACLTGLRGRRTCAN
jgi:hypothetical protein